MTARNTTQSFGSVARTLHWLTALLILTAIPLGLYANALPYGTSEELAFKAQVFSLHKTLGVTVFFVALVRILWALVQPRPVALHPERRLETAVAEFVHWLLYISLLAVPLSGWIHHAATTGFAPILWPFGQDLPLVPKSLAVEQGAAAAHWLFTKLLAAAILLHVAGAVKHHVLDRDDTLLRMTRGIAAGRGHHGFRPGPAVAALVLYLGASATALALLPEAPQAGDAAPQAAASADPAAATGNWAVQEGTVAFTIRQMGADVTGQFSTWTADITFDPGVTEGPAGHVTAQIDLASLTLGSVTTQALSADFLDVAAHPTARFEADILPAGAGYEAQGTLTLRGVTAPLTLPFTLEIADGTARMQGETGIDRRTFAIGAAQTDEATVGFEARVTVALTAIRRD